MQSQNHDVIIVGGGPAGASAATILGQSGRKVLLIEKEFFPREKTCGDGMTFKCVPVLKRLGIDRAFTARAMRTAGYRMVLSDGTEVTVRKKLPDERAVVYTMPRIDFDNLLLENVKAFASVRVLEGTMATRVLEDGGRVVGVEAVTRGGFRRFIHAPLVIDASGVDSKLAAQFSGRAPGSHDYALTIRGYYDDIDGLDNLVEFVFDKRVLPGYFWIFPVAPDAANVGCGTLRRAIVERDLNLREVFMDFANTHPSARILRSARLRGRLKGGKIPLGFWDEGSRVRDGIVFCGDAAGFCDPLTAEGISFALESGVRAGETATAALAANDFGSSFLSRYDASCREAFSGRLALADIGRKPVNERYFLEYLLATLPGLPALQNAPDDIGAQYELMFRIKALLKAL